LLGCLRDLGVDEVHARGQLDPGQARLRFFLGSGWQCRRKRQQARQNAADELSSKLHALIVAPERKNPRSAGIYLRHEERAPL
jgi:hypothetical protein